MRRKPTMSLVAGLLRRHAHSPSREKEVYRTKVLRDDEKRKACSVLERKKTHERGFFQILGFHEEHQFKTRQRKKGKKDVSSSYRRGGVSSPAARLASVLHPSAAVLLPPIAMSSFSVCCLRSKTEREKKLVSVSLQKRPRKRQKREKTLPRNCGLLVSSLLRERLLRLLGIVVTIVSAIGVVLCWWWRFACAQGKRESERNTRRRKERRHPVRSSCRTPMKCHYADRRLCSPFPLLPRYSLVCGGVRTQVRTKRKENGKKSWEGRQERKTVHTGWACV